MIKEFKAFIMRGNVVDLAVGVIIGAAFGKITSSLVEDVIMPPIGMLIGKVDFSRLFITLAATGGGPDGKLPVVIKFGSFINQIINFVIVAAAVFLLVKAVNSLKKEEKESPSPATKECPRCCSQIAIKASKCPSCTADLA